MVRKKLGAKFWEFSNRFLFWYKFPDILQPRWDGSFVKSKGSLSNIKICKYETCTFLQAGEIIKHYITSNDILTLYKGSITL